VKIPCKDVEKFENAMWVCSDGSWMGGRTSLALRSLAPAAAGGAGGKADRLLGVANSYSNDGQIVKMCSSHKAVIKILLYNSRNS